MISYILYACNFAAPNFLWQLECISVEGLRPACQLKVTYKLTLEWPWHWDDLYLGFNLDLRHVKPSWNDVQVTNLAFSKMWSWPWPNALDTQTWPRYGQDVPPYKKMKITCQLIQKLQSKKTDRYTDSTKTLPTYVRGWVKISSAVVVQNKKVRDGIPDWQQ